MDIMSILLIGESILIVLAIITSFIGIIISLRKSIKNKFDDLDMLGMVLIIIGLAIISIIYHLIKIYSISQEIRYHLAIPFDIIAMTIIALGLSLLIEKRPIQNEFNKIET